jgi:hypothetical protein
VINTTEALAEKTAQAATQIKMKSLAYQSLRAPFTGGL